jgi:hypothetical protein
MLAGFVAPTLVAGKGDDGPKTFSIEAPDDVSIEVVSVLNGPVTKGQQLLRLKSFNVERMEIHIALFKEHIDVMERPFKDGRIDQEIAMLKQKAGILKDTVDWAGYKAAYAKLKVDDGSYAKDVWHTAQIDLNKAKVDLLAAQLAADQAEKRRDDTLAKIQVAKDKLALHEKMLDDLRASMIVISSADGHYKSHVETNVFVKKGHVLGEFSL